MYTQSYYRYVIGAHTGIEKLRLCTDLLHDEFQVITAEKKLLYEFIFILADSVREHYCNVIFIKVIFPCKGIGFLNNSYGNAIFITCPPCLIRVAEAPDFITVSPQVSRSIRTASRVAKASSSDFASIIEFISFMAEE